MDSGGALIHLKIKEKNMTQEQLAERLNTARQTVSKWENNERLPDLSSMKRLAVILNFSIDKALGIEAEENDEDDDKLEWLIVGDFAVGNAIGIAIDNYMLGYVFAAMGPELGFALKAFKGFQKS